MRTVQRECRWDPDFNEELRKSQSVKADPRELMHAAARTHWRAAAWLLEREDPENYGRRPASSCSPQQFDVALRTVLEAALQFAPPEVRGELFDHLELACEAAFKAVFPLVDQWGGRRRPELPPTPLVDEEKLLQIRQSRRVPAIPDNDGLAAKLLAMFPAREAKPNNPNEPPNLSISENRPTWTSLSETRARRRSHRPPPTPTQPHDERLPWKYAERVA